MATHTSLNYLNMYSISYALTGKFVGISSASLVNSPIFQTCSWSLTGLLCKMDLWVHKSHGTNKK
jgi:hypothetical protein